MLVHLPSMRVPIDTMPFVLYAFLSILGYFVIALLAVTPHTHALRIGLWLVVTLLSLRAVASLDMSLDDPDQRYNNTLSVVGIHFRVALPRRQTHNSCSVHDDLHNYPYLGLDISERTPRATPASNKGI